MLARLDGIKAIRSKSAKHCPMRSYKLLGDITKRRCAALGSGLWSLRPGLYKLLPIRLEVSKATPIE
jgi:hypothetical protein